MGYIPPKPLPKFIKTPVKSELMFSILEIEPKFSWRYLRIVGPRWKVKLWKPYSYYPSHNSYEEEFMFDSETKANEFIMLKKLEQ